METSSQATASRGLWNSPRATQFSKETQDMLRLLKQESRVTSLKRKQINKQPKNETALPFTSDPAQSSPPGKSVQKHWPVHSQKRTAEACRSGNSYEREKFRPGPTRDLEKEKRKLQNIFAHGTEQPGAGSSQKPPQHQSSEGPKKMDRYQEVLNEIQERRQFLEDMASLGQEKDYIDIINTEISQKLRELEIMEKSHVPTSDTKTERTENAANKED
ncbi:tribbles-like protein [Sarotherodon galilaeus]